MWQLKDQKGKKKGLAERNLSIPKQVGIFIYHMYTIFIGWKTQYC